ncbi:hypothetical protein GCM10009838_11070 [Catenulispora subtropica]|uniref:Uncharacterized protein n=1 Tax=Catenulispora subtropica TaxID=450798 RepID=A0ABP5C2Y0_9ACTN
MEADGPVGQEQSGTDSRLVSPAAASLAICNSCGVSRSKLSGARRATASPAARSSARASSPRAVTPKASKLSVAARSGDRESVSRRRRLNHLPYASSNRARCSGQLDRRSRNAHR